MSATFGQTAGNLIKCCMGVGVLALPLTTYYVGFIPALILTTVIAFWVYYCMHLLVKVDKASTLPLIPSDEDPYKTVCKKGLGGFGVFLLNFSFIVTLVGVGAAYQITFNDLITGLHWDQWHLAILKQGWVWTLGFAVLIYPLVLLRSMSSISFASQAGNYVLIAVLIIVITYGAIYNHFKIDASMLWPRKYFEIADFFGVICFSMGVAFIGLSSRSSMEKPDQFNKVLSVSLIVPCLIYIAIAFLGVGFYNESGLQGNILMNIPPSTLWYMISAGGLSLVCFLSYPIAVYPALIACESWIKESESKTMVTNWKRILLRLGVVCITSLLAIFVKNFKEVVSFIGCFTISIVTFILPPLLHLRILPNAYKGSKFVDVVFVILGCCVMVVTTVTSILS